MACSVDGCDRKHYGKGFCAKHYQRWRTHGTPHAPAAVRLGDVCAVADCDKKPVSRGWCPMHYQRWRLTGTTDYTPKARKVRVRRVGVEPCEIDGCEKPIVARGWCSAHWTRWQRHGSPTARLRGEVVAGRRICPGCRNDVPLTEWYTPPSGRSTRCRECFGEWNRARASARRAGPGAEKFTLGDVIERDGVLCGICGDGLDLNLRHPDPLSPSLDHRHPLSRGGTHTLANSQAAHLVCNMRKWAKVGAA